jgi:hypothetical protein
MHRISGETSNQFDSCVYIEIRTLAYFLNKNNPHKELPLMDIKYLNTLSLEELQQLRDQTAQEAILAEVKCKIQMNWAWIQHAEAPIEA